MVGIYQDINTEHYPFGLENGHWESLVIDGIKDFNDSDKGALKILSVERDVSLCMGLISRVADTIIARVEKVVLPAIDRAMLRQG